MTHPITVTYHYTDDDLENILITALEGGIGYWACLDNGGDDFDRQPRDMPTSEWCWKLLQDGGSLHFYDAEAVGEDDCEEWYMDLADLYKGVGLAIRSGDWSGRVDDLDATVADSIIQYALFGSVIYG